MLYVKILALKQMMNTNKAFLICDEVAKNQIWGIVAMGYQGQRQWCRKGRAGCAGHTNKYNWPRARAVVCHGKILT